MGYYTGSGEVIHASRCDKVIEMKNSSFLPRFLCALFFATLLVVAVSGHVFAQAQGQTFEAKARAADGVTLVAGKTTIRLWAVEKVNVQSAAFDLKARAALSNALGSSGRAVCQTKGQEGDVLLAQCNSSQDQDLGLFMIQQGFATVDRTAVYGTVFEDAYVQAEMQAQDRGLGVWGQDTHSGGGDSGQGDGVYMVSFGFILFLCVVAAFSILSIVIMRGFQKVSDAQNRNVEMMTRERKLRDKERGVVAVMLDSELKANKAKIEAYCVVYEEMLKSLREPSRAPKYKKSGDIIQKQPALARSVFDRNTDKLDMMGAQVSSELVHFYARIKSNPEYVTLEPTTPLEEAVSITENALKGARKLDNLLSRLLHAFAESGVVSEDFQD